MVRDIRETLDRKIHQHQEDIIVLASMVEQAITDSVQALVKRDVDSARAIYSRDKLINEKRHDIERQALITVATQQPMASDLRKLSSIIDIAGELERIGDYAKGIARIVIRLSDFPPLKEFVHIPRMADLTADMLHRAISAFVELDEKAALAIPREDDEVDELYNKLYHELLKIMFEDRNAVDHATFLMWVSHNLERAADRVTNICERTVFTTSGKLVEFDRSDDESDAF